MSASSVAKYVDAQGRTDAELYLMGVLDGSIVAGNKLKMLAEKMLPRIRDGYKIWHYDPAFATRPVAFVERFLSIPSGKLGVPFILEPYERMIVELGFGFVDDNNIREFQYELVEVARKNGKGLALDEELPTPYGWRKMGELHVDDIVYGQDGKPSRIIAESEIFDKPTYLVTFEDGSTLKSTDDHIWTIAWKGEAIYADDVEYYPLPHDVTTQEMFDNFEPGKYRVPMCKPVERAEAYLRAHPYDIGWWLVGQRGVELPDEFMDASIPQRMAVVSGIEDTAATIGMSTPTFWCHDLAEKVAELYASLGIYAMVIDLDDGTAMVKADRSRSSKAITSIERIPNEPTKCIAIDNESHLYLAGRRYTATHNTSLVAALELYMLLADGEGAAQIYNAATSKAQASLAYGAVWRMVRQSPKLRKHLRKGTVTERAESGIICDGSMGYITPLSKQSDHLDGLDVHMCAFDEMAAAEDRSVFDLIRQGTGARRQPLMMAITTQGFVRDNLWDHEREYAVKWLKGEIEDDRFLGILFEMDDRSEIYDEAMWPKANPGIGTVKSVEYLRSQVTKAKNDASYLPTVLTKDFNLPANQATAFLTFEEAVNTTTFEFDPRVFKYCIVGIDAADTLDLNAATALFMRPDDPHIYRRSMYWIAEEQVKVNSNSQRGRDGVPYLEWADRGLIRIVPGNRVDHRCFLDWIQELADEGMYTRAIGYDRWGMREIRDDMNMLVGEANVIPIAFGPQSLSTPMKELKAMMRDGLLIDNNNSIDHWCNMNVTAKVDVNDNVQPIKKSGATTRIDGFAALLCAYKVLMDRWDDYQVAVNS